MTIKGRLLSSTAIVSVFRPKIHLSDRLPFPLEFRNHIWHYKNRSGGAL